MAQNVEVRLRLLHAGRIMVERRRHTWCSWVLFLFWRGPWQDWFLLNEKLYQIHDQLNYMAIEFKELVAELESQEKALKANLKDMEGSIIATKGYSDPFLMDAGLIDNKVIRDEPKQEWRAIFTNEAKRKPTAYEKIHGKNANHTGKPPVAGLKTLVAAEDLKNRRRVLTEMGNSLDVDEVMTWDNNRDKDKNQDQNWRSRKRRKGESPEDHTFRLESMDAGTWPEGQ